MSIASRTRKLAKLVLIIQLTYLVVVNALLQLPLTQTVVNMIRPEKFEVSWDNAWSWYPFRVHAEEVAAHGQSRSQQWQVSVSSASGSISLLPLILKRVWVRDVSATDINYRQRPRLKPDKDYSGMLPYFPDISGRDISPAITTPRKKKRPWHVSVKNIHASGKHSYWIYQLTGGGQGRITADLSIETGGGPFTLNGRDIDLQLDPAYLNTTEEVFRRGRLTGKLGFAPFVPRENKGIRMLAFLQLDALLDLEVNGLGFINLFTSNLGDMIINGSGQVEGSMRYKQGYVLAGTDLRVNAEDLSVRMMALDIGGNGTIQLVADEQPPTPMSLDIDYNDLAISREQDADPFVIGENLHLHFGGSNYVIPDPDLDFQALMKDKQARAKRKDSVITLTIDSATMTDMNILNDYLLSNTPLKITGGNANLSADILARPDDLEGEVSIQSSDLRFEFDQQSIQGDLDADITLAGGVLRNRQFDISGSTLALDNLSVIGEQEQFEREGWSALFTLVSADTTLTQPPVLEADAELKISDSRPFVALFSNHGGSPRWLSRLLEIKDIEGTARVEMADDRLMIPHAHVISDKAEIGAKGEFTPENRNGIIYARYKKLDTLLKINGDNKDIDVIKVREKYDNYQPAL